MTGSDDKSTVMAPPAAAPVAPAALLRGLLSAAGYGALVVSLAVVVLGIGDRDLGPKQLGLALGGFGLLLVRDWLASPAATRTGDQARYLTVALELAALTVLLAVWRLEGPGVYERIVPLAFVGFLLHHALAARFRPVFFLALSVAGIGVIFGITNGALLLAVGLGLIAVCHLPVAFRTRVAILVAAGTGLGLMRAGVLPWNLPAPVWPILASMFMFRLVVYLYDLRHGNAPPGVMQRLSYFFMLPNTVFPLFPVVDSSNWHRRYYDAPAHAIYQRGVDWMFRGVLHLIAYRFLYQRLTLSPAEVTDTATLAQYLVVTFGLYLRVSGQFHLIVGLLHLFGHRLPETHRLYFLASSFTDLWRRINIYWKDFVQKVFFFPVYFRVRKKGETYALVVATLAAFAATWFLHSYQWFWILGRPLVSVPDVLFWVILGSLVLSNSMSERKRGRIRKLDDRGFSAREIVRLGLGTGVTFLAMCMLWTVWNSSTMTEWITLFSAAEWRSGRLLLFLAGAFAIAFVVAAAARWATSVAGRLGEAESPRQFVRQAAVVSAGLAALFLVDSNPVSSRLSLETRAVIGDLHRPDLNPRDADLLRRGYYENLMGVSRLNTQLWEVLNQRPDDWVFIAQTPAGRETGDFLDKELVPGAGILFRGKPFRVNQWGMRDREYAKEPAPGTTRVAILGASYVVGSGVADGQPFESVLEDLLNEGGDGKRYEILNFAVQGYTPPQQLHLLERRVLDFRPQAVWHVAHHAEPGVSADHVIKMVRAGVPLPYPYLEDLVRRAGVTPALTEQEAHRLLRPFHEELIRWIYGEFVARCRERGVLPVWIFLPTGLVAPAENRVEEILPIAREAGFTVVDLSNVYEGHDLDRIMIAVYDRHPTPEGHRIIARRLLDELRARPELFGPAPAR